MGAMPIPNMNPTGVIGSGSGNTMAGQTSTPFSSFMPAGTGTGGAGTMNFGNAANPNPTQTSANPYTSTAATPGGASPTTGGPVMNPGQAPAQPTAPGGTVTGENNQSSTSNNNFNQ